MEDYGRAESGLGIYGQAMGQNMGIENPLYYDALQMLPSASTTTMWNMRRVQNTLLNNNRSASGAGGVRQTLSPFRFNSLANVKNVNPMQTMGSAGVSASGKNITYSPFNFMARSGNAIYGRTSAGKAAAETGQTAFARGTLGTAAAGASLMARGGNLTNVQMTNSTRAISAYASPAQMTNLNSTLSGVANRSSQASILTGSQTGGIIGNAQYSGRAVGYFQGAQAARMGTQNSLRVGANITASGSEYVSSIAKGSKAFEAGKIGARVAGSAGASLALRAAGPIGTALLVRDLAKGAGRLTARTVKLGIEATKSAQGDLTKSGFGLGYVDNSVAATSRQRGVLAISNSRLNARSALGAEAGYMHSRFG